MTADGDFEYLVQLTKAPINSFTAKPDCLIFWTNSCTKEKALETRDRIINVADVFHAKGVSSTKLADVADAARNEGCVSSRTSPNARR